MILRKLFFTILLFLPFISFAQNALIKGSLHTESGTPLKEATVYLKGTSFTTVSDENGNFKLKDIPYGDYTFEVNSNGNVTVSQQVKADKPEIDLGTLTESGQMIGVSQQDNIPEVELSDEEINESTSQNVSSSLGASRDVFSNAVINVFSAERFSFRGYDNDASVELMNGVPMSDLSSGRSLYNSWSGLNDVLRSRESSLGLTPVNYAFGGIGGTSSINSTAIKQRKQIQASFALSNRNYDNRTMLTYGSGLLKGGWSVALSGSRRWANEGFIEGTYYDAWGYYASVTKNIDNKHFISFTTMGAPIENGRGATATQEAFDLTGTHYYNPNWGYQSGEKRNAGVNKRFQPLTILSHEWKIDNSSSLISGVSFLTGKNKRGNIDWYNAASPRPDYYRYLPSYYKDNPEVAQQIEDAIKNDPSILQINWNNLYEANRSDSDGRAHYILYDDVSDDKIFSFNTTYNKIINDLFSITGGISYQHQTSEYYKEISDLLGAEYYLDVNQFATTDITQTATYEAPNNMANAGAKLHVGDKYGYDYEANISKATEWIQGTIKLSQVDLFLGTELSQSSFYRNGKFQNGIFPDNSLGKSEDKSFFNIALKGGATYKLNGRNYLFANGAYATRAPYFENAFISPNVRNKIADDLKNETVTSVEGGYLLKSPRLRARAVAYYTAINDAVDTKRFYLDYGSTASFVNYTIVNLDKTHSGVELAAEMNIVKGISVNAVATINQFLYNDRPYGTISYDNANDTTGNSSTDLIYLKNYHIGNKPEQAYTLGFSYRSPKFWFVNLNFNFFNDFWYEVNPIRRTSKGVDNIDADSDTWSDVLDQQKTDGEFTVDLFGGWSWKVNNKWKSLKRNTFLVLNVGVNNLLNNKNLVTAAREQLRFDYNGPDTDVMKFAPKFSYGYGTNFFVSLILRMN